MAWWLVRISGVYLIAVGAAFVHPAVPLLLENRAWQTAAGVASLVVGLFLLLSPQLPKFIWRSLQNRAERRSSRYCQSCGYDLCATIHDRKYSCPECGAPVRWWTAD